MVTDYKCVRVFGGKYKIVNEKDAFYVFRNGEFWREWHNNDPLVYAMFERIVELERNEKQKYKHIITKTIRKEGLFGNRKRKKVNCSHFAMDSKTERQRTSS